MSSDTGIATPVLGGESVLVAEGINHGCDAFEPAVALDRRLLSVDESRTRHCVPYCWAVTYNGVFLWIYCGQICHGVA